jgi:hypothetical protein
MNDYDDKKYEGKGEKLKDALDNAWNKAKADGAPAGTYNVELKIETENPIRGYIVVITPDG